MNLLKERRVDESMNYLHCCNFCQLSDKEKNDNSGSIWTRRE